MTTDVKRTGQPRSSSLQESTSCINIISGVTSEMCIPCHCYRGSLRTKVQIISQNRGKVYALLANPQVGTESQKSVHAEKDMSLSLGRGWHKRKITMCGINKREGNKIGALNGGILAGENQCIISSRAAVTRKNSSACHRGSNGNGRDKSGREQHC
jgi:hypothetical protein